MRDYFDDAPERLDELARRVRKSEAYPAILGAIAGGIAGAFIALLITGMRSAGRSANSAETTAPTQARARGGWTPREVVELLTVGAAIAKQAREWYRGRAK